MKLSSRSSRAAFCRLFAVLMLAALFAAPAVHAFAQETPAYHGNGSTPEARSEAKKESEADENDAYRKSAVVRALGAKLGMNADQSATAFEVINFVILAIAMGWVLAKTLPKTFRNRSTAIQKHLVDARTATEEASLRLKSVEERLSKLDSQIAEMRSQAEKDAAIEEQRIKASVEEEKQKILASAEQEIAAAAAQAHRQLQEYAAGLAIDQAARKLVVSAETDRLLVQGFARRLAGDDKGGQN